MWNDKRVRAFSAILLVVLFGLVLSILSLWRENSELIESIGYLSAEIEELTARTDEIESDENLRKNGGPIDRTVADIGIETDRISGELDDLELRVATLEVDALSRD